MSRRTRGRDAVLSESVQLRTAFSGAVVTALARRAAAEADRAVLHVRVAPPEDPAAGAPVRTHAAPAVRAASDDVDPMWAEYLAGPSRAGRDRLLVRYMPLVRVVAHRTAAGLPTYVDISDLAQAGIFGLVDAVERFDPERSPRFESYAAQRIRGAMLDELRAQDWVPRTVRGRAREIDRVRERLETRLRRAATDPELAAELGVTLREFRVLAQQVQLVSTEALDEGGGGLADLLADDAAADPMAVIQARETVRLLRSAVSQLGDRDQQVVHMYYLENLTLAEIGRRLGVTESRVCQLHTRLVGRLRSRLAEMTVG